MAFIYTITNTVTRKMYVGSTTRLLCQRWGDHKSALRTNTHANIHLQRSWNKYGEDSFLFEQLEECDNEFVLSTEQYWMHLLDVYKNGYNRNPIAGNSFGVKRSRQTCINIGLTGNWKKANKAWKGSTHTERTRKRIREKRATQVMKPMSDETKQKIQDTRKARGVVNKGTPKYFNVVAHNKYERLEFATVKDAMEYFKLIKNTGITRVLRKERKYFKGYMWNALLKSGELMGTPEMDNHEPS